MGIGQSQWYSYRCRVCRHETEIEDIVVESFVVIACPQCGGAMQETDDISPPKGR
jgi:predicted nucleic acid-binding Zn ribbon protein